MNTMSKLTRRLYMLVVLTLIAAHSLHAQHSVAREWNELLLEGIRGDFARPTVHARNLFHVSAAMYDAWAVFDDQARPFLLGQKVEGFAWPFDGFTTQEELEAAREKAISYAAYRLLRHRFERSPDAFSTLSRLNSLMINKGYDRDNTSLDYSRGDAAALGNYIAEGYIQFGLQDGSNEANEYANQAYEPFNEPLIMDGFGNPKVADPNRWQPLTLDSFVDQSGNPIQGNTPAFLSPEWGEVVPFALKRADLSVFNREGWDYWVYHDPGHPPYMDTLGNTTDEEYYKWGFSLVAAWSSHLDPSDSVMWDISPAHIGNIASYPTDLGDYANFYNRQNGLDPSRGREINPATGEPYPEQWVPRGDYARVLAEFWADGPDSETPPGHWFTILNYVADQPELVRQIHGEGPVVDTLEWDIKAYFTLGGAMHDAAITSWGIKGWYDYIRPVSAIRWMAERGQSSDPNAPSYHPDGLPLIPGFIEIVQPGDPAIPGAAGEIKIKAWKGPDYIGDPEVDEAGVDWILAKSWWPYQRPTFVTPPFAGYISGHSTYSSAAAEVLSQFTGSEYFPGGVGEFEAPKNEFLVFEEGPSVDVVLQWATYRDASDQCSLSRIWGGIHPPADDIPGRHLGIEIGTDAMVLARAYFEDNITGMEPLGPQFTVYPNPLSQGEITLLLPNPAPVQDVVLLGMDGRTMATPKVMQLEGLPKITLPKVAPGIYILQATTTNGKYTTRLIVE